MLTSPALLRLSRFTVPTTPTTVIHGLTHTGRKRWPIGSALGHMRLRSQLVHERDRRRRIAIRAR